MMQLINYKATDPCPYSGMTPNDALYIWMLLRLHTKE